MMNLNSLANIGVLGGRPGSSPVTLSQYIKSLSGLVAYYPLDETSGDAINHAPATFGTLNGTVTGATQGAAGQVGLAYAFDGENDEVTGITNSLTGAFTFVCLFNRMDDNPNWILGQDSGTQKIGFFGGTLNINLFVRVVNGGSNLSVDIGYASPAMNSVWHLLVVKRDGSNNLFGSLDGGDFVSLGTLSGTFTYSRIGHDSATDYYFGSLQHIAVTTDAKAQSVVDELFALSGL